MKKNRMADTKTDHENFLLFHEALMSTAPIDYLPWYFPVKAHDKSPDGAAIMKRAPKGTPWKERSSWKADHALLTSQEAISRLIEGGNVGLAARKNDPLVIQDFDDKDKQPTQKKGMVCSSRSRWGTHLINFSKEPIQNIPSEFGEVRSQDQYIVAPGSYVPTTEQDGDIADDKLGCYTYDRGLPTWITEQDLAPFFLERLAVVRSVERESAQERKSEQKRYSGQGSALFALRIEDVVPTGFNRRCPHPLHPSDTGTNFMVSPPLAHCWRHSVSLNALQYLVVESGYMTCLSAGTGHSGSGAGPSDVKGDDGAIFHAWRLAKQKGLIPHDDPMPTKAMVYLAKKHGLIDKSWHGTMLPPQTYYDVIALYEEQY